MRHGSHCVAMFMMENTLCSTPLKVKEYLINEGSQAQQKVLVFAIVHGSGNVFGPYFLAKAVNLNQYAYNRLLTCLFVSLLSWPAKRCLCCQPRLPPSEVDLEVEGKVCQLGRTKILLETIVPSRFSKRKLAGFNLHEVS